MNLLRHSPKAGPEQQTWIKDDAPRLNASMNSFLCLLLHFLPYFLACVLVMSKLLHGLRRASHMHQDVGHI